MTRFDYVIVGAGPAGCVLANRLSADPRVEVLSVEAGDWDSNPLIAMPRGFGELLGDPATAWHYPTRPFGPSQQVEYWVRGKTLGGSSSVNGMVYSSHRADYDALEHLGNPGWGWDAMVPVFKAIEDNALGGSEVRGAGGPLHVSTVDGSDPLLMDRPNLAVALNTVVDRVVLDVLEDRRAVGVRARDAEFLAAREVILATGAIATPKILQLSGVGPVEPLRSAGVDAVVDSPNVGARMREHRVFMLQLRLEEDLGYNRLLGTEAAEREYRTTRRGPLAAPGFDIAAFFKTRPELDRPDAQIQIAPYSILPLEPGAPLEIEREPGMLCVGFILRSDSEGSIRLTSSDPDAPHDYQPTVRLLTLAAQLAPRLPLVAAGRRAVRELENETHVTAYVVVPCYSDVLVVAATGRPCRSPMGNASGERRCGGPCPARAPGGLATKPDKRRS